MVAEVPSVVIYAGDTTTWPSYTFQDGSQVARNLDAEGWTNWVAQWRDKPDSSNAITLSVDTSLADQGIIVISATSEQTEAMNGNGVWDLQSQKGSTIRTWIRGKTRWTKDITRV